MRFLGAIPGLVVPEQTARPPFLLSSCRSGGRICSAQLSTSTPCHGAVSLHLPGQTALAGKPDWASWLPVSSLSCDADDNLGIAVGSGLQKK